MGFEHRGLHGAEGEDGGDEHGLLREPIALPGEPECLEGDALMSRVLINDDQAVAIGSEQVGGLEGGEVVER